jgi:hypothetical protein
MPLEFYLSLLKNRKMAPDAIEGMPGTRANTIVKLQTE